MKVANKYQHINSPIVDRLLKDKKPDLKMKDRSSRNYRSAKCCESCEYCDEEFHRDQTGTLTEDILVPVCTVDQNPTLRWFICSAYKERF